jgi:acetyl-CoA carboxylase biotin carboxyl carrier protein
MDININQIRELADLALEKNLAELTVTDADKTVTIRTSAGAAAAVPHVVYQQPMPGAATAESGGITASVVKDSQVEEAKFKPANEAPAANRHTITAPMVGTFYRSPSPESPAFVEEGQVISIGQTLCIIEAMKLMNELESDVGGRIVRILVQNGQPVEFGQPLFEVEPNG